MEDQKISEFIQKVGEKIEEVSGAKLNFRKEATVPKEECVPQKELVAKGQMSLRTAEQTGNMNVVRLKRFDPYFWNKDREIACRVPDCSKKRKFVQKRKPRKGSKGKSEEVKRDLFLCKDHHEKLTRLVSKRCEEESVIVDVASFEKHDFKGYTSLISSLEKAFMHLKSKWWRESNDFLLAEIFLNTRNFLIITNALLNPNEDNTTTVLGPFLTTLLEVLGDRVKMQNGIELLREVMPLLLIAFGITYEWIRIPIENPGARIGAGLSIVFAFLVSKIFNLSSEEKVELYLAFWFSWALIAGGLYNWHLGPRVVQERNERLSQRNQQFIVELMRGMSSTIIEGARQVFNVQGDPNGNVSMDVQHH